jgi:hypothetical protein
VTRQRSVGRSAYTRMNRINVQFFNRANRLWYTKPLISRVS